MRNSGSTFRKSFFGRILRATDGGALVEVAVVMPILLLILTGVASFSTALHDKVALAEGVSAGGKFLATDGGDNDPCAATANKIYIAAPTLTQSKISLAFNVNGKAYSGATCSGTSMPSGATVEVTASYPCSISVFGKGIASCTIGEQIYEVAQ